MMKFIGARCDEKRWCRTDTLGSSAVGKRDLTWLMVDGNVEISDELLVEARRRSTSVDLGEETVFVE